MKKIILQIEGMTCSACSSGLEKYLKKQEGIEIVSVNLVMANASICYDDTQVTVEKIEEWIQKAGFKSLGEFKEINERKENRKEKYVFFLFSVLAFLLLYIAMGHMFHLPSFSIIDIEKNPIGYTFCLFLNALLFMGYGFPILKNGYKNLIHKTPNMDTLVSIGVVSSFLYSTYTMFLIVKGNLQEVHHLYFEASAMVLYFVKLGRTIDRISKDKTKEAIGKLVKITPDQARIRVDEKEKQVTIDMIKKGDILIGKPGDKIAVDGEITIGKTHIDESFLTGESKPKKKGVGDKVMAGSINYDGYIEYKAEKIGRESTISEMVKMVLEASNHKVSLAKLADTISSYFVPIVFLLAFLTFFVYLVLGYSFEDSFTSFLTILVVACPCSLGLATPLAQVIAEGICIENGILVKKGFVLEQAKKIDTIVFDKTGTLTYGKPKMKHVFFYTNEKEKEIFQKVGSLESKSSHPIGRAFTMYLKEHKIEKVNIDLFQNIEGMGIIGTIANEEWLIGNGKIIEKYNIQNAHKVQERNLKEEGCSIVYVVRNRKIIALLGLNDVVREEAREVVQIANQRKIHTIMLTGDSKGIAFKIANEIGIKEVIADVLPIEKTKIIKTLKKEGRFVLMCGDGINDAPALVTSDIGMSVREGSSIAIDAADVILTKTDLYGIIKLLDISKETIRKMKQNLFWAFFYNILMIPIAMGLLLPFGISIHPMLASLAMVCSSLTVIINTLFLKRKVENNFSH